MGNVPGESGTTNFAHAYFPIESPVAVRADDYRPTLTPIGALERDLLDRFDGTHSAAELESWLAIRSQSVLPSAREAAAFLKQTIERCG